MHGADGRVKRTGDVTVRAESCLQFYWSMSNLMVSSGAFLRVYILYVRVLAAARIQSISQYQAQTLCAEHICIRIIEIDTTARNRFEWLQERGESRRQHFAQTTRPGRFLPFCEQTTIFEIVVCGHSVCGGNVLPDYISHVASKVAHDGPLN